MEIEDISEKIDPNDLKNILNKHIKMFEKSLEDYKK